MVLKAFYSLVALVNLALAADVNYVFNIVNGAVAPDGYTRNAVLVNGVYPGTLIQANKDDVLHITVNNQLTDPTMRRSTSIHWHGLFQMRTASEDGPAGVTQCPISPGHSYTYDIPLNGQAGTHWYHSHLSSQYVDGIRGAIVIYDPNDPHASLYDVDDASTVITLADWYHKKAPAIQAQYLAQVTDEPVPDSGLINGVGRYEGGPNVPWPRINVESGKRYRFRIINTSAYAGFEFSIEKHDLKVIEVDGINHVPKTVKALEVFAGQRYSVVVHANQQVKNYWIRAPMEMQGESDNDNLDAENVFGVLHYAGASSGNPTTKADDFPSGGDFLQEHQLAPLENPGAPGGSGPADRVIDLSFTRTTIGGEEAWTINGIRYHAPTLPTLLNIMGGATVASDFTTAESTYVLERNQVIELVIHGSANGHVHPFHLHGHPFDVIQGRSGTPNYVNPPRRDVVGVKGSTVIIRFTTDNPGPWFLHCHLDWHLEAGLAVVFAEAPAAQRTGPQSQIIKPEWEALCPIYNALPAALQ
ncbi:laccase 17 [Panaeolus papilionaceus]|nr:laccase 17 [Panaeolus papilionaceus]